MKEKIVKCGTCEVEFDILKAKPCNHDIATMLCPNGHCICHLPLQRFRLATEEEKKLRFGFVLKSVW